MRLTLSILLLLPSAAFAFSSGGHRIIAEIAWRQLETEKRSEFVELLKHHPRFEEDFVGRMPDSVRNGTQELKDHWLFLEASVWPDTVRGLKGDERKKYHRGPWHYVNFPTYLDEADKTRIDLSKVNRSIRASNRFEDDPNFNIIQATKMNLIGLQDKSRTRAQRAVHLCWVAHLVGDAHQPLHSTAMFTERVFPDGDRGGNLIKTDKSGNLHSLWDRLLPYETTVGGVGSAASNVLAAYPWLGAKNIKGYDPKTCIEESQRHASHFAYTRDVKAAIQAAEDNEETTVSVRISEEYMRAAGGVARRRAIEAGFRLADVLGER